jgi:protein-S-isoprenylcysteine O-methyltransferase Ste14
MDDGHDTTTHSKGTIWVIVQAALFVFFLAALIAGETLDDFAGLVYLRSAGILIALFGSFVSFWSFRQFGSKVSPFPMPVDGARLIETGPYRYVRHPMYSGIIAFTFGAGLAYASPAAMLASVLFLIFFLAKTGREEEMLVDSVPGYRAYRSRVEWRLIPKII